MALLTIRFGFSTLREAVMTILTLLFMSALSAQADLALTGATIYANPTDPPIHNGTILIHDGKIAAAGPSVRTPPNAETIRCDGLTITASLWNSHIHFFERKWTSAAQIPADELTRQLEDMFTRYGFTNAFDLSSDWRNTRALRDRIESGEIPGPRIRSTGEGLIAPNPGLPPDAAYAAYGSVKVALNEVADGAQAAAAAKKLLDAGVDAIKLFISAPSKAVLSDEAIVAAVAEAHRARKPVFVHPNTTADVMAAVRGGVDIIAHVTAASDPWNDAVLAAMKQHKVAVIPTFTVFKYNSRHDRVSMQEKWLNTGITQLRAWVATGGEVLFGTDGGYADYDPLDEYLMMAQAGMSFSQILASLTTTPAEKFGESKNSGRIEVGMSADLAIFRGDPAKDLRALTDVRYTLRDGRIIYRARN